MNDIQGLSREAYVKLGELASRRRIEMGLPAMELATMIGLPVATLTSFEHGLGANADEVARLEEGLDWGSGIVARVVAQVQDGRIRPHHIQMEYLDAYDSGVVPESGPIGVFQFPCKWCGETLRVNEGLAEAHECPVPHPIEEHYAYMLEQIERFGERHNG